MKCPQKLDKKIVNWEASMNYLKHEAFYDFGGFKKEQAGTCE